MAQTSEIDWSRELSGLTKERDNNETLVFDFREGRLILFWDGSPVGWIAWEKGHLSFKGRLDESAQALFEVFKGYVDLYVRQQLEAKRNQDGENG